MLNLSIAFSGPEPLSPLSGKRQFNFTVKNSCDAGHVEISFDTNMCPLCTALNRSADHNIWRSKWRAAAVELAEQQRRNNSFVSVQMNAILNSIEKMKTKA